MHNNKFYCRCCGYLTIDERNMYEICPICFWEDDNVQAENPDLEGGANTLSLRQAQKNYINIGACCENVHAHVRKPTSLDKKDPHWQPLK